MAGRSREELNEISKNTRFSGSKAVEAGKKGAAVSAKVRAQHATFRESFKEYMTPEKMERIFFALSEKAEHGDVHAAAFLRDTMGEKPTDRVELEGGEMPLNVNIRVVE